MIKTMGFLDRGHNMRYYQYTQRYEDKYDHNEEGNRRSIFKVQVEI